MVMLIRYKFNMKYAILGPKDNSSLNCPQKTEPVNPMIFGNCFTTRLNNKSECRNLEVVYSFKRDTILCYTNDSDLNAGAGFFHP